MKNVVIIGGGLSGYLIVLNFLRFAQQEPVLVTLIEKEEGERLGLAYATADDDHLLNVPVGRMSAFHDTKDHFSNWLHTKALPYTASSFVPRRIYRLYILEVYAALLAKKHPCVQVTRLRAEVTDVQMDEQLVLTDNGQGIPFDQLILATGNFTTKYLPLTDQAYINSPGYYHSAWNSPWAARITGKERILIVGTGLTMADTLLSLQKTKHTGTVTALSRHGLIPAIHKYGEAYSGFEKELPSAATALGLLRSVRQHLTAAEEKGLHWQAVIDAIRPHTSRLWRQLPDEEKGRFMRHLSHYWEVCRHRMSDTCAAKLAAGSLTNRFNLVAGRILTIQWVKDGGYHISLQKRGRREKEVMQADLIINCMGPATHYAQSPALLFQNLSRKKLIVPDPLGLGLLCTEEGALIGAEGVPAACFYTIGAPKKGLIWETTAVPEIREQAYRLTCKLLDLDPQPNCGR